MRTAITSQVGRLIECDLHPFGMAKILNNAVPPDLADDQLRAVHDALEDYERAHPTAEASLYRYATAAVRCRVIDPRFAGMNKSRRQAAVFDHVRPRVDDKAFKQIWEMLCLAPDEVGDFRNLDFENPTPLPSLAATEV